MVILTQELPSSIGNLRHMITLNVGGNRLQELPGEVGRSLGGAVIIIVRSAITCGCVCGS